LSYPLPECKLVDLPAWPPQRIGQPQAQQIYVGNAATDALMPIRPALCAYLIDLFVFEI
jgi:hypothetical protein